MDIKWFIVTVCCFTIVFCYLHYKKVINVRKESVGIFLTLLGLFLTVGTDYVSQFDNPCEMLKKIMHPKYVLDFEEIRAKSEETNPHYLFALDVSGSMKEDDKPIVQSTEEIDNIIKRINNSGYSEVNGWNFYEKDEKEKGKNVKKIAFYRLLQARLMNTIIELDKNKHKNNLKYTYSVVLFAGNPYCIQNSSIDKTFKQIYYHRPDGIETDFIDLFEYLCERIEDISNAKDRYKPVDCYVVLFSDYLHDDKELQNKLVLEKKLKCKLHEIHRKNVSLKFFYYDVNYDLKKDDIINMKKNKKDVLPVDSILKNVFPNGSFEEDDALLCPIISPKPISFFHSNSLYEEELSTQITFDSLRHKKYFYFSLGKNSDISISNFDELKQEYYLIEGTDRFHLSSYPQPILLDSNDVIDFKIKGYIPAPYKSPDIIIEDGEEKIRYAVPVTFYKKLPYTGYILLALLISFFLYFACVLMIKLWHTFLFPFTFVLITKMWNKKNNVPQPFINSQKDSGNNQQPTGNGQQDSGNTQQDSGNTQQDSDNGQQDSGNGQQDSGNGQQDSDNNQQPSGNTQQDSGNTQQPSGNNRLDSGNNQQDSDNNQRPSDSGQQDSANSQQPSANNQRPSDSGQQDSANNQRPSDSGQQDSAYNSQTPVDNQQNSINIFR